ncbi:hypothetical protein PIROE2DRAFT_60822 [Piromyces sp. E2]|nr:hypothetical protein PIROE2DRAFT_60822 [Piromyces sp. E2]|eukprot:OUM64187.1 hypothetical protein PIROE2DRAFT_60822 [Piromyces sp. E2]
MGKKKGYYRAANVDAATPLLNALYKCSPNASDESICGMGGGEAKKGFYLNGSTDHLIACQKDNDAKCKDMTITADTIGYYLDAGSVDNYILCNASSADTFTCTRIQSTGDVTKHYLDADTKGIITCVNLKCYLEDEPLGYFLNDSILSSSTKHVISCGSSQTDPCEELTDSDIASASAVGKVKYASGKASLCISTDCATVVDITNASTSVYKTIKITADNNFPGATLDAGAGEKSIAVKIGNGSAIMMTDAHLPECKGTIPTGDVCFTDATNEEYCIHTTDKKIYLTTITDSDIKTCTEITKDSTNDGIYYFDSDHKLMTGEPDEQFPAAVAYQCTFNDSEALQSCELAKGYTKIDKGTPKYIYCSGWKGEGCVTATSVEDCLTTTSNEDNARLGKINDQLNICTTFDFPLSADNTVIITVQLSETSEIYGKLKDEIITLSASETQVLVVPDDSTESYFINYNDDNDGEEIIKCDGTDGCILMASQPGYYLDASYKEEEGDTTIYTKLIHCTKAGVSCTSMVPLDGYYIDATAPTNIIYCVTNTDSRIECTSDAHGASDSAQQHYIGGGEKDASGEEVGCQEVEDSGIANSDTIGMVKYGSTATFCVDEGCGHAIPDSSGKDVYETIEVTGNNFPGIQVEQDTTKEIYVKIGKDGSVILLEDVEDNEPTGVDDSILFYNSDGEKVEELGEGEHLNVDYVAFETTDFNPWYGIPKEKVAFLHVSEKASLVVATGNTNITTGYHRNVAVNADDTVTDNRKKALVYCETAGDVSSCASVDAYSGYYLNAGSDQASLPLITCSKAGGCSAAATQTTGEGCVVGAVDPNKKLGIDFTTAKVEQIAVNANATPTYETIEYAADDTPAFPDATAGERNPIKIRPDGSVILLEDASLPLCTESIPDGDVCFTEALNEQHCITSSGEIYVSRIADDETKSCTILTGSDTTIVYFDKDNKLVDRTDPTIDITTAVMAYQCTFGDNDALSCSLAKGITKIDADAVIYCNGWVDETCHSDATTTACANDVNGAYGTLEGVGGLCFSTSTVVEMPSDTDANAIHLAFEFSTTSTIYGQTAGSVPVLTLTATSALIYSEHKVAGKKEKKKEEEGIDRQNKRMTKWMDIKIIS